MVSHAQVLSKPGELPVSLPDVRERFAVGGSQVLEVEGHQITCKCNGEARLRFAYREGSRPEAGLPTAP